MSISLSLFIYTFFLDSLYRCIHIYIYNRRDQTIRYPPWSIHPFAIRQDGSSGRPAFREIACRLMEACSSLTWLDMIRVTLVSQQRVKVSSHWARQQGMERLRESSWGLRRSMAKVPPMDFRSATVLIVNVWVLLLSSDVS